MICCLETSCVSPQVPMVPAAVGPPMTRLAVPGGNMKLMSGVSLAPGQLSGQPGAAPGARAIQLPSSVSKPGQAGAGAECQWPGSPPSSTGPVAMSPQVTSPLCRLTRGLCGDVIFSNYCKCPCRESGNSQASPVNLTVSRAVVAPAMAIPNFNQTTLMYDAGRGAETGQSSVTITILPAPGNLIKQEEGESPAIYFSLGDNSASNLSSGATLTGPATITPAQITPIMPGPPALSDADKTVPGSPRPSILRKRPDSEAAVMTPVKGAAILVPLSATSSLPGRQSDNVSLRRCDGNISGLSGDETHAQQPPPSIEPSPRKKPRKQQMPPRESNTNVSPEWATVKRKLGVRNRLEWNTWRYRRGMCRVSQDSEKSLCYVCQVFYFVKLVKTYMILCIS